MDSLIKSHLLQAENALVSFQLHAIGRKWHQRVPRKAVSCMMLVLDPPEPQHMSRMQRQSLVAYGQPLCETVADCPSPRGAEVLVRIERCGVCHSDLHLQDGYFSLGADKKLDVSAGRTLRFTLGHVDWRCIWFMGLNTSRDRSQSVGGDLRHQCAFRVISSPSLASSAAASSLSILRKKAPNSRRASLPARSSSLRKASSRDLELGPIVSVNFPPCCVC